jgi:hypothetical protein
MQSCTGFGVYQATFNAAKDALLPNNYIAISPDYFAQQKYSFAMVKIGNADPLTMVLQSIENDLYKWVSSEGVIISTNSFGRILKTQGLSHDVNYTPLADLDLLDLERPAAIDHLVTFYNPELIKIQGAELYDPEILATNYDFLSDTQVIAQKINFQIKLPLIKWTADGHILLFDGRAIASSQSIHPHFPQVDMYFYYKL